MRAFSLPDSSVSDFDRLLVLIPGLCGIVTFPTFIELPNGFDFSHFEMDSNSHIDGRDKQTLEEFAYVVCQKIIQSGERVAVLIDSVGLDPTGLYNLIEKLERGPAGIKRIPATDLDLLMATIRRTAARHARHGNSGERGTEATSDAPPVQPEKVQKKHTRKRRGRQPAPKEVAAAEQKLLIDWENRIGRTSFEEFANQRGLVVSDVKRMINSARKRRKSAKSEE